MPLRLAMLDERLEGGKKLARGDDHRIRRRGIGGKQQQGDKRGRHRQTPTAL